MPSNHPASNPQSIWKNQSMEAFKMSADELRRKTEQRQKKSRVEAVKMIASGLIGCGFFAFAFFRTHTLVPRLGFGLISLWGIYLAWQAYQWMWPGRRADDAALNPTLRSYREELERQRDYVWHIFRRTALPVCFLGMAMVLAPRVLQSLRTPQLLLLNMAPLLVLFVIWCAIFFPHRRRSLRKLQHEIDELRGLEAAGRS
jgi:hypothetical protein